MKNRRISKNTSIDEDYWGLKTQKEFVEMYSSRVDRRVLVKEYKSFTKNKPKKKSEAREVNDESVQDS